MLRALLALTAFVAAAAANAQPLPRTADGKPDLQGIWQVHNRAAYGLEHHDAKHLMPAGPSVVDGGEIPYLPAAREQQRQNFENRATADPLNNAICPACRASCTWSTRSRSSKRREHVAITFEWSQVYRLIYTNGQPTLHEGIESWMGNSRGRWEGDVLVVEVTDHNDRTWLDAAGNFHSSALQGHGALRDARREHDRLLGHDRRSERVLAAVDDPHAVAPPDRAAAALRVPLPSREVGGERRLRARPADVVSGADPGRERAVRRARRRPRWRRPKSRARFAACPTASRTSRAGTSSTPAAATTASSRARRSF